MDPAASSALTRAAAGVLGGLCAVTVMHPVDIAQKRIQVQDRRTEKVSKRIEPW